MIYYNIETNNGIYKVRKPMGRIGALHFGIITKYMPANKKNENDPISPAEQERIGQGFEEWAAKVLPNILVSFTSKDGDEKQINSTEEMDGQDQYGMFLAICSTMETSGEFFRIL